MSKIINYLMLFSGISLVFYFAGLLNNTATTTLLNLVLNPGSLENSNLMVTIFSISTAVIAVISTFVARSQNSDFYLFIPLATLLFSFGWDFLSIYTSLAALSVIGGVIGALVFGPLMIGYIIAVVEWWRGVST